MAGKVDSEIQRRGDVSQNNWYLKFEAGLHCYLSKFKFNTNHKDIKYWVRKLIKHFLCFKLSYHFTICVNDVGITQSINSSTTNYKKFKPGLTWPDGNGS
jgi:hypothetical protein